MAVRNILHIAEPYRISAEENGTFHAVFFLEFYNGSKWEDRVRYGSFDRAIDELNKRKAAGFSMTVSVLTGLPIFREDYF